VIDRTRTKAWRWIAILFLIAMVPAAGAAAQTVSGELEVRATVVPNCRLIVAPLIFGDYDPIVVHEASALDAESELRLTCTRNSSATISLDHGRFAVSGSGPRVMTDGSQRLAYQLFQDPSRAAVWGQGEDAVAILGISSLSNPYTLTIYGRIPPGQEVLSGSYSDVVTAIVDF
jgi:spore coat protein U-like protein